MYAFVFWNFDWYCQITFKTGCSDGCIHQLLEGAQASQSHQQQHELSSLWVSACLVGEEWNVGRLSLELHFSYSENHRVFENSEPQVFALGNGLRPS